MIEEMNWTFLFKSRPGKVANTVYSKGWLEAIELTVGTGTPVTKAQLALLGGTGPNANIHGDIQSESFLSPSGEVLTNITLSNAVKVEVPD